jgi:hypothetical protein
MAHTKSAISRRAPSNIYGRIDGRPISLYIELNPPLAEVSCWSICKRCDPNSLPKKTSPLFCSRDTIFVSVVLTCSKNRYERSGIAQVPSLGRWREEDGTRFLSPLESILTSGYEHRDPSFEFSLERCGLVIHPAHATRTTRSRFFFLGQLSHQRFSGKQESGD